MKVHETVWLAVLLRALCSCAVVRYAVAPRWVIGLAVAVRCYVMRALPMATTLPGAARSASR